MGLGYSPTPAGLSSVIMTSNYVIESITLCQDVGYDENTMGAYMSTLFYAIVVVVSFERAVLKLYIGRKEAEKRQL